MPPINQNESTELLRPGEDTVPLVVQHVESFLKGLGIWFQLSRNHEARSCRDAAHKRNRLGHQGIPLWDEMKSFLGRYEDRSGQKWLFLAHCRADHRLDAARLSEELGAKVRLNFEEARLTKDDMEALGLEYGVVNPWETWTTNVTRAKGGGVVQIVKGMVQVFDRDLLPPIGTPGTVMTNAGALTWAVEFHPRELKMSLHNAREADISEQDPDEKPRPWGVKDHRPIGIITGNPPEAGMYLWQLINKKVREALGDGCCGDLSMPRMEVVSVPEMGLSMELEPRLEPVESALEKATRELVAHEVKLLALPCNTTSYFAPKMHRWCEGTGTRFLSMAEVAGEWLRREGVKEVALVGINYVADLGHWSAYREALQGVKIELLDDKGLQKVRDLAYKVKVEGPNHQLLSKLRDILNSHVKSKHVVLALTELSLLVELQKGGRTNKVLIDPMNLYAEALVSEYLGLPSSQSEQLKP